MANREAVLQANDETIEELDMPEWGFKVHIRTLRARERDVFYKSCVGKDGRQQYPENMHARFCALVLCNESGDRLFSDQQVAQLGNKSARALDRIFDAGQKLNKMNSDAVEEAEKNLEAATSGDSPSD